MIVNITAPPSANNLFYTGLVDRRRHKSTKYKAWIDESQREMLVQGAKPVKRTEELPCYKVDICAHGLARARDLDNIIKPIIDLLQHCGIIDNDKNVNEIHAARFRGEKVQEGATWVSVEASKEKP